MAKMYSLKVPEKKMDHDVMAKPMSNYLPTIEITSEQIPTIGDYKVGDVVELITKARVKRVSERESGKVKIVEAYFEILEAGCETMTDDRKKAEKMGIEMDSYKKLKEKKRI